MCNERYQSLVIQLCSFLQLYRAFKPLLVVCFGFLVPYLFSAGKKKVRKTHRTLPTKLKLPS